MGYANRLHPRAAGENMAVCIPYLTCSENIACGVEKKLAVPGVGPDFFMLLFGACKSIQELMY